MDGVSKQRRSVASLAYIAGFVTGVVILMVEPADKYIRFHAMQSTIATGSLFILNIVLGLLLTKLGIFSFLSTLSGILIWLAIIVICAVGFYQSRQGRVYKFPYFGQIAEKKVS